MLSAPDKPKTRDNTLPPVRLSPFLRLFAAQTLGARDSASEPVGKLIESFTNILVQVNQLVNTAQQDPTDIQRFQSDIEAQCNEIRQFCNQAITQLQFADALSQRLEHVAEGLQLLEETASRTSSTDHTSWSALEDQLLDSYTVASEETIHKTIFSHSPSDT